MYHTNRRNIPNPYIIILERYVSFLRHDIYLSFVAYKVRKVIELIIIFLKRCQILFRITNENILFVSFITWNMFSLLMQLNISIMHSMNLKKVKFYISQIFPQITRIEPISVKYLNNLLYQFIATKIRKVDKENQSLQKLLDIT